ncbi:hypothetical protein GCM10011390_10780 [Aureimonas endophytica]|uniref:DUF2336 domain-containing protein n=1 Tax=Aureimonas endophytica TaxID=2027858 RepID=A0A917E1V1_9HYPH|nr:hypothetical protein [Aureimonas endophytica]GGD93912.1 hypothetical protein GCM10011390_10780 [Aureimonas endophytica]
MSDASPRIFRNLERSAGRDGFDTIVRAAVAAYAALRRPTDRQCRDFGGLVGPVFAKTDRETRRIVAASLANAPKLPQALVERLLAEPVEIAAPFLLGSPLLTEADLARLHARNDPALSRILEARRPTPAAARPEAAAPRRPPVARTPTTDAPPVKGGVSRQAALLSLGSAETSEPVPAPNAPEPQSPAPPRSAASTREWLRRQATGQTRPAAEPARPEPDLTGLGDLVALASVGDRDGFAAALGRRLLIDAATVAEMLDDASGAHLATALKACDFGTADAMTVLMTLAPKLGTDVAAFKEMQRRYEALDAEASAARFGLLAPPETRAAAPVPQYAAEAPSIRRPGARAAFGRRKPVAIETGRLRNDR